MTPPPTLVVAGHQVPVVLARHILDGSWPPEVAAAQVRDLCGEAPDPSATFYTLDEMEGETARWKHETSSAYLGLGEDSLDPARSVLIGDLGYDRPLAIDLRQARVPVRLLAVDGRWRVVSDSIEHLLLQVMHDLA